jgi:transposase-like protein
MGKRAKRHSAEFKFKVVLESFIKGNVSEVARQYGVNANQLSLWRKEFAVNGHLAFEKEPSKVEKALKSKIEKLENLIGKKEVEISLLKNYLDFYAPLDGK